MFALVSPSISSARLIAIAARCAIARAISVSSSVNGRAEVARPRTATRAARRRRHSGVTSRSATSSPGHSVRAGGRDARPSSAASSSAAADSARASAGGLGRGGEQLQRRAGRASRRYSWQTSAPSSRRDPARDRVPELAGVGRRSRPPAPAPTGSSARRPGGRCWSYSCAFSIAPETSEAMWTSSFSVSSVNSRGASVWSTITPIVSSARDRIGTATYHVCIPGAPRVGQITHPLRLVDDY